MFLFPSTWFRFLTNKPSRKPIRKKPQSGFRLNVEELESRLTPSAPGGGGVNAPVALDNTLSTLEDTPLVYQRADFNFSDPNDTPADNFVAVQIVNLPTNGVLKLGGVDVTQYQLISTSAIDSGLFAFVPDENENGISYATWDFAVKDSGKGTNTSATQVMTVDVTAVNDSPSLTASNPDASHGGKAITVANWATFSPGGGSDESSQTPTYFVTNVSNPDLFTVAPTVAANGTLSYTLANVISGSATFDVTVQDDGGTDNNGVDTSATSQFTISVTASYTVNTLEDYTAPVEENGVTLISLRAAIDAANSDADDFVGIEFSVAGTINLENGALPNLAGKTFAINGSAITVDAQSTSGIFCVDSDATATIDNFTLTNSANTDAVYNEGTLSMTAVMVANAQAGGVQNFGGTMTLTNETHTGNTRTGAGGAALNQAGGTLNINGGWYDSCSATTGGGAIASNGNGSTLNILNGSFLSNTTAGPGGAIFVSGGSATLTGAQVYWNQAGTNQAPAAGGGISFNGTTLTLSGCEIMVNTGSLGGGVYVAGGNLNVQGTTQIYTNTATLSGGGIYFAGGTLTMFANSTLYQNGAGLNGGGLYLDTGTATLTNVSVTSNTAAADGGGFYVRTNRTLTVVQGCTVSGNTANSGNGGYKQPNATLTENRNNNTWGANDDVVQGS